MIAESGRVPRVGLQEMVLRAGGTLARNMAEPERGWAAAELGQFNKKAQGLWKHTAQWRSPCLTLPGPWV